VTLKVDRVHNRRIVGTILDERGSRRMTWIPLESDMLADRKLEVAVDAAAESHNRFLDHIRAGPTDTSEWSNSRLPD